MTTLRDIMTTDVYSTGGSTSVTEVARAMERGRFGSALIMESGWLAGIFTERDVLRAAASGSDLTTSTVSEWMTKDPASAAPDMTTDEAMQIMATNGFRHLPIVDGKSVVGIVSLRDVLSTRIARTPR